ncbi:hypothetical protein [Escherichia phage ST2]|nr:hypothetical protein [Escherichia phage ST2]
MFWVNFILDILFLQISICFDRSIISCLKHM